MNNNGVFNMKNRLRVLPVTIGMISGLSLMSPEFACAADAAALTLEEIVVTA